MIGNTSMDRSVVMGAVVGAAVGVVFSAALGNPVLVGVGILLGVVVAIAAVRASPDARQQR